MRAQGRGTRPSRPIGSNAAASLNSCGWISSQAVRRWRDEAQPKQGPVAHEVLTGPLYQFMKGPQEHINLGWRNKEKRPRFRGRWAMVFGLCEGSLVDEVGGGLDGL